MSVQRICCGTQMCATISECDSLCSSYVIDASIEANKISASIGSCGTEAGACIETSTGYRASPGMTVTLGGTFTYTGLCNTTSWISGVGNTKWNHVGYAVFEPSAYDYATWSIDDCSGLDTFCCSNVTTSGSFTPTSHQGATFSYGGLLLVREHVLNGTSTVYDPADIVATYYYWVFSVRFAVGLGTSNYTSVALAMRTNPTTSCPFRTPPAVGNWDALQYINSPIGGSQPNYVSAYPDLYFWNRAASFCEAQLPLTGGGTLTVANTLSNCAGSTPTIGITAT